VGISFPVKVGDVFTGMIPAGIKQSDLFVMIDPEDDARGDDSGSLFSCFVLSFLSPGT